MLPDSAADRLPGTLSSHAQGRRARCKLGWQVEHAVKCVRLQLLTPLRIAVWLLIASARLQRIASVGMPQIASVRPLPIAFITRLLPWDLFPKIRACTQTPDHAVAVYFAPCQVSQTPSVRSRTALPNKTIHGWPLNTSAIHYIDMAIEGAQPPHPPSPACPPTTFNDTIDSCTPSRS